MSSDPNASTNAEIGFTYNHYIELYFFWEECKQTLKPFLVMLGLFLVPLMINRIFELFQIKVDRMYFIYRVPLQYMQNRVLYTRYSLGDVFVMILWALANIGCVDYRDFPRQLGYLIVANTSILLMPIFKNSLITLLTGVPFERGIRYHRWLGKVLFALTLIHMIGYWIKWASQGIFDINTVFNTPKNMWGHVAFFAIFIILVTSLSFIRRRVWEVFQYSHYLGFVTWWVAGVFHHPQMLSFSIIPLALYFIDIIISFIKGNLRRKCEIFVMNSVVKIKMNVDEVGNYEPGGFAFICLPKVSRLQWHPISFSSTPRDMNATFHILAGDHGWAKELTKYPGNQTVLLDYCYGKLSLDLTKYKVAMLTCGGIGATPIISLLKHIFNQMNLHKEPYISMDKIYFIWTMRTPELYDTLGGYVYEISQSKFADRFVIKVHLTGAKPNDEDINHFEVGRPDWQGIFKTVRKEQKARGVARVAVLTCGADQLVQTIWDESINFSRGKLYFDFHQETFLM